MSNNYVNKHGRNTADLKTSSEPTAQAAASQTSNICFGISLDFCWASRGKHLFMSQFTSVLNLAAFSPPESQQTQPICGGHTGFQQLQTLSKTDQFPA